MSNKFEPICLQDAKRHIQWLYDKIKKTDLNDMNMKKTKTSFVSKILIWLKKVF